MVHGVPSNLARRHCYIWIELVTIETKVIMALVLRSFDTEVADEEVDAKDLMSPSAHLRPEAVTADSQAWKKVMQSFFDGQRRLFPSHVHTTTEMASGGGIRPLSNSNSRI